MPAKSEAKNQNSNSPFAHASFAVANYGSNKHSFSKRIWFILCILSNCAILQQLNPGSEVIQNSVRTYEAKDKHCIGTNDIVDLTTAFPRKLKQHVVIYAKN